MPVFYFITMAKMTFAISCKKIGLSHSTSYFTLEKDFNNEDHCKNWIAKYGDTNYRKVIGYDRVYSIKKEHSVEEMRSAYEAAESKKFSKFEEWYKFNFKKNPE